MIRTLLFLMSFTALLPSAYAEAEEGILPQSVILGLSVSEVNDYRCPRNMQCQVRCSAGPGHQSFEYQNVRRFEMAKGEQYWLLGAVYIDPVGKGHSASGMLPAPVSCLLDDLDFLASSPVIDGTILRPDSDQEVIFDLSPTN